MKNGVTFRFQSRALIPTADGWSNWTHCDRATMIEFLRCLGKVDEMSAARLSPDYKEKYSVISRVNCIDLAKDESWTWTPDRGWFVEELHPEVNDVPTGKGKRPPRKTAAERKAEQETSDNEIFGTV